MAPNAVINADASAMPDKNILERFPVSPNLHGPTSRIAPRQSLQRGKPCNKQGRCWSALRRLRFLHVPTEPDPHTAQEGATMFQL